MSINERIKIIINLTCERQNIFARSIGMPASTLNTIVGPLNRDPTFSTLKKIIDAHPTINLSWLMKDEGMPFLEPANRLEKSKEAKLNSLYNDSLTRISQSIFLSANLRLLREHIQITQDAFAKILGITRNMIASYERGVKPKLPFLIDIENYFHISLEELISLDLKEHPEIIEKLPDVKNKKR